MSMCVREFVDETWLQHSRASPKRAWLPCCAGRGAAPSSPREEPLAAVGGQDDSPRAVQSS
eukprot:6668531-Pyramimonas_sp.AAC.1